MPSLIVLRTHIAYGAPNKQDTAGAHGAPLGEDEVELAKKNLDYPSLEPFYVPDEVRELVRAGARARRRAARRVGRALRALGGGEPGAGALSSSACDGARCRKRCSTPRCRRAEPDSKPVATRSASGKALNWLKDMLPELIGGSADLAPSNETHLEGEGDYLRHQFDGRNMHFGVREHAMGAIVNGMVICGLRAYGATFLTFSDYMRGSIRLAALMEIPSLFIFTHDSIGLGEDGPTHQPVEQLAALRAMPNLEVIRPADVNESYRAWRWAVAQQRAADRAGVHEAEAAGARPGADPRRRDRARRVRLLRPRR